MLSAMMMMNNVIQIASGNSANGLITTGLVINLATAPASGNTWTDITGNGYNGTINGSSYSYTSSNSGGIVITGYESGTYISTPYNLTSNTFTISMAASFNPTNYWATLWGNEYYSGSQGYFAVLEASTTLAVGTPTAPASFVVPANLGSTLAIWDFVISGKNVTIYKNGVSTYTGTMTSNPSAYATDNLYFGSRHANTGGATNADNCAGTYYSMRVYNVALNSTQIAQNFAALRGTYGL